MAGSLENLLTRLREDSTLLQSGEEATRQGVVLPILGQLDWDRDNVREVVPEFTVGNRRVDYCLKIGDRNSVFIEVKPPNQKLEPHQEQLLDYAFRYGIEIAALTNGVSWWLYLPLNPGSWDQRKFLAIDIQQQEAEAAAQHFRQFLARDTVADGSSVKRAQEVLAGQGKDRLVTQTIPKAWKQLCSEPDDAFLKLFTEKVESMCGHRPDEDLLRQHLARLATSVDTYSPPLQRPEITDVQGPGVHPREPSQGPYTKKKVVAYTFRGQQHQVSTYKAILMGLCHELYRAHPTDFDRVLTLRGRTRKYFSRDSRGMTMPQLVPDTLIYAETNLSATNVIDMCGELLKLFGHSAEELQVEARDR